MMFRKPFFSLCLILFIFTFLSCPLKAQKSYFIRFKVNSPVSSNLRVTIWGYRHSADPWYFPGIQKNLPSGGWSEWIDLSGWNWHGKVFRSGGMAEYPSLSLSVRDIAGKKKVETSEFEVQLADAASEKNVVISFTEKSDSDTLIFLAPYPLRANAGEFETARQMIERQVRWSKEVTGGNPIKLKKFEIVGNIWNEKSPALKEKSSDLLQTLGFNVIQNADPSFLEKNDLKFYKKTLLYLPDPELVTTRWEKEKNSYQKQISQSGKINLSNRTAFWEISDEVKVLNFNRIDRERLNKWFSDYLQKNNFNLKTGQTGSVEYPLKELSADSLPKNVSLPNRKFYYYAAKFGQWWSAGQLHQITELIRSNQPGMNTSTLLPSHGFFGNTLGASKIGMSYGMLDIFELVKQKSVTRLAVEDWFGLNHMYGPNFTWTGGQSFGYFNAIVRSAIGDEPISIQGLITPSDDKYLRLKAYSSLGQGAKSFYFWSYGPTFVSTENYWSDLRSQYEGLAKLNRSLQKAEDVLYPAKPQSDPVAILYSVSHDLWNNLEQAPFVEKRLLWHGLRHLQIQPDFIGEEAVATGKLNKYKVLYITDWNISREASLQIDQWVKNGGILYLSAGAATRDEFNEPFLPPFAEKIWEENPTGKIENEKSTFNERTVLPGIKPLTEAVIQIDERKFELPVIGTRLNLKENLPSFAKFRDGKNAGATINYGKGRIFAVGFMPMLAYGKMAGFKPKTLEEKWPAEPRIILKKVFETADSDPLIKTNVPVVETSLLNGSGGSVIVLANYTYQSVNSLILDVKIAKSVREAISVEGRPVKILNQSNGRIKLQLPLDWTDLVILK